MGEQAVVGRDPGGRDNAMAIVMGDARREADELQPVAVQVDGDRGNRRTTLESQIDRRRGSRAADDIAILVRARDREAQYQVVGNDQNSRASCRERGGQKVEVWVDAANLKK